MSTSTIGRLAAPLAITVLGLLAGAAWAMPPHFGGSFHGGLGGDLFAMERMADRLDLTDAQRTQMEDLFERQREQARPHVRTLVEGHDAMRELMHAEDFDEAKVRALAGKQAAAMAELMVIKARGHHDMWQILTPEQRQWMEHRRQRHGRPDMD